MGSWATSSELPAPPPPTAGAPPAVAAGAAAAASQGVAARPAPGPAPAPAQQTTANPNAAARRTAPGSSGRPARTIRRFIRGNVELTSLIIIAIPVNELVSGCAIGANRPTYLALLSGIPVASAKRLLK